MSPGRDTPSEYCGRQDSGSGIPDGLAALIAAICQSENASNRSVNVRLALPLSYSVEGFAAATSISRSGIYEAIASGGLIARHPPNSRRTLITLFDALNWLATLPRIELSKNSESAGSGAANADARTRQVEHAAPSRTGYPNDD